MIDPSKVLTRSEGATAEEAVRSDLEFAKRHEE
jgi:hypothetical protein